MNGRIYDPLLGRFLSPDPLVEDAGNLQTFNRYSYVHNNPLTFLDPDGNSKARAVGWVARLLENAVAPRVIRQELTHKALANAMAAGGKDLIARSAKDAWKIANILEGRGAKEFFKHEGHAIRNEAGEIIGEGMKHIQSDSFKGRHIFYASMAALVATVALPDNAQAKTNVNSAAIDPQLLDGVHADVANLYDNKYPGESVANNLTVTHWVGENSILRHLDWVNPGDLIAMGGDIGRALDRETSKELVGFAVTTLKKTDDGETPQSTYTFDKSGELQNVSTWKDGKIAETISAEEYFKRQEEEKKKREAEKK